MLSLTANEITDQDLDASIQYLEHMQSSPRASKISEDGFYLGDGMPHPGKLRSNILLRALKELRFRRSLNRPAR